jgi:hypothetical protein
VLFSPAAIIDLTIEDGLSNWVETGQLTVFWNNETIENKHVLRNDGYDTLFITIYPTREGIPKQTTSKDRFLPKYETADWTINGIYSIYEIEDIPAPPGASGTSSNTTKCKRFYFRDIRYQDLSTQIVEYSTATSQSQPNKNNITAGSTDSERSLPTGVIISDIIKQNLGDKINNITTDTSSWDNGKTNLFLTSPANATAFDLMMYAYNLHIASDSEDFCVLTINRGPKQFDFGEFTLRPIREYFNRAGNEIDNPGNLQIEHFFIQDDQKVKVGIKRSPNKQSATKDLSFTDYSLIRSYEYVEISPETNAREFTTRPVYSFDLNKRLFRVEFEDNDILAASKIMNKNYVQGVMTRQGSTANNLNITLDEHKKDRNLTPVFSLHGQAEDYNPIRKAAGMVHLLKTGLFQNAYIIFNVPGLTSRQSGTFIAIDRISGSTVDNNLFDDKFCGQWFVLSVKNVFQGTTFTNEIVACKIHRYQTLPMTSSLPFTITNPIGGIEPRANDATVNISVANTV